MKNYLIGELSMIRDDIQVYPVKFVNEITKDMLLKAKEYSDYQIVDLVAEKYFNPEDNKWADIK